MNITLTGTKIMQDTKFLAFEKNNGVDVINITVDTDESWSYKLDVKYPEKCCTGEELYNIIDLNRDGDICSVELTSKMLPFAGKYTMQLRAINGDKVKHSDTFDAWIKYSIEPASTYDPVPSEFYQIEQNVTEMNNHPPKPGQNGYWLVWDITTSQYKESAIPLPDGTLPEVTVDTSGKYLSNDGKKAYWAEVQAGTEGKIDKIEVNNVEQPIIDKTVNIAVPTKTSQLTNDSGFITDAALTGYAKTTDIPTKTSQLENDSHYITANEAPVTSVNSKTGTVLITASDVSAIPSTLTGTAGQVLTKTADGQEWKDVNIPTALPNPNALTFTGAVTGSYDGSAPVNVEIPSGGGSGSAENWRLVNTVTTAEDVKEITITQDSDGNPLSLKKVKVFAKVRGNSAGLSAWCRITVNGLRGYLYSIIPNTFAATEGQDYYLWSRVDFAIYAGRLMIDLRLASLNNAASRDTLYYMNNQGWVGNYEDAVDSITSINIWSASAGIGAGTEIQIYGVDAG